MRLMLGSMLVVWLMLSSSVTTRAQQDRAYPIHFGRKVAQGDHFLVETTTGQHSVMTTEWQDIPKPVKTETTSAMRILSEVAILQVDESGEPVKEECRISSFTQLSDDGKGETSLVPPQSVIIAEGGETETTFTMDGKPVAADVKTALGNIIRLQKTSRNFDWDQAYGTTEVKHVGDQWSGNSKVMMDWMIQQGMTLSTAPSIEVQLVAIESYNNIPCLKIHMHYEAKDYNYKKAPSPEVTLKHSTGVTNFDVWMPLDLSKAMPRSVKSETVKYEYEGVSQGRHYSSVQDLTSEMQFRILKELP